MKNKKVVIANLLTNDIDKSLAKELKEYDNVNKNLGDAFLLHLADSLHNLMTKRARFVKTAAGKKGTKSLSNSLSYFQQIYPSDFAKKLHQEYGKKGQPRKEK